VSIYMNIRDLIGEATEYDKKLELDVTQDVTQDVNSNDLDTQIIYLIKKDDKISTEQMSKILEVSTRTIKRHIKEMNNIKYIGSGYSGHWEIL
jgi:predicted HTH transcriptional regulator